MLSRLPCSANPTGWSCRLVRLKQTGMTPQWPSVYLANIKLLVILRSWTMTRPPALFWWTYNDFPSDKHGRKIPVIIKLIMELRCVQIHSSSCIFVAIGGQMRDTRKCWQDIDGKIEIHKNIKDYEALNIKSRLNEQIIQIILCLFLLSYLVLLEAGSCLSVVCYPTLNCCMLIECLILSSPRTALGGKGSQGVMNIWPSYSSSCYLSPSSLYSEASSSGLEEKRRLHVNEPDSLFNWRSAQGSLVSHAPAAICTLNGMLAGRAHPHVREGGGERASGRPGLQLVLYTRLSSSLLLWGAERSLRKRSIFRHRTGRGSAFAVRTKTRARVCGAVDSLCLIVIMLQKRHQLSETAHTIP